MFIMSHFKILSYRKIKKIENVPLKKKNHLHHGKKNHVITDLDLVLYGLRLIGILLFRCLLGRVSSSRCTSIASAAALVDA